VLSNLRATVVHPLPLGLPALATLLGACALVVDVEDCRTDAVCGPGRVCVDGACLTVAPSPTEAGLGGGSPTDEDAGRPGLAASPLPEGCDERLLVGGALLRSRLLGAASAASSIVQTLEVDAPADLPRAYDRNAVVDLTFETFIRVGDRGDFTFEGTAVTAIQQSLELDGRPIARGAPALMATLRLEPGLHALTWSLASVAVEGVTARLAAGPAGQALRVLAPPAIQTPHQCDGVRSPCESASDADVFGAGACGP